VVIREGGRREEGKEEDEMEEEEGEGCNHDEMEEEEEETVDPMVSEHCSFSFSLLVEFFSSFSPPSISSSPVSSSPWTLLTEQEGRRVA
jgi:hypothetical protein